MMLDFEDRMPAPRLSISERLMVAGSGALSAYGMVAALLAGARVLKALALRLA